MSNVSEEGISKVKEIACDKLMQQRTDIILNSNKNDDILKRVHVSMPVPRDDKERPIHVPDPIEKEVRIEKAKKKEEEWAFQKKLYKELDPDYTGMDWKEDYIMENEDWKHDRVPEIMDGKNIFDFWSGDIEEKIEELEMDEVARLRALEDLMKEDDISQYKLTPEQQEKVKRIREKRKLIINDSRLRKKIDKPRIPKKYNTKNLTITDLESHLESLGMDSALVSERLRSESRPRSQTRGRRKERETSEERELSKTPLPGEGYRNVKQRLLAEKLQRQSVKKLVRDGRRGESDRHVFDWKPKHLFTGKGGIGSKDFR
jgi:nucleolar GTP-binding protein